MNWFIIHGLVYKLESLCTCLNSEGNLQALIPRMEYYRRDHKAYEIKPMFPGYLFIKADMNQVEFDSQLLSMHDKYGFIKQIKYKDSTALTREEVDLFEHLLDGQGILRMSKAVLVNNQAVVMEGPLRYFQDHIVKVDKHNQMAYLDIWFMKHLVKAGMCIVKDESEC